MAFFKLLILFFVIAGVFSEDSVDTKHSNDAKEERFLEGLLDDFDINIEKVVNKGSSIAQKVQQFHGPQGTTIVKTETTHYSTGNFPVGARFKRGLFDDAMDTVHDKMKKVKHKVSNILHEGYAELHRIKDKLED